MRFFIFKQQQQQQTLLINRKYIITEALPSASKAIRVGMSAKY